MNLYLCSTPLQILIANYLIDLKQDFVDVLVLTYTFNEKYEYYLNKIKNNRYVNQVDVIRINEHNVFTKLMTVGRIILWGKHKKFHTIYLASIDNFFMHCVLHYSHVQEIYTFDDGTANIIEASTYFVDRSSTFSRIARKLLNIRWNLSHIKISTRKHYTIYRDIKNIVDDISYINVFGVDGFKNSIKNRKVCSLFLGQPFNDREIGIKIYKKLKNNFCDIRYFIHPRENFNFIDSVLDEGDIVRSDLIVEEYIFQQVMAGIDIVLLTVSSSAGFNLYYADGVQVKFVVDKRLDGEVGSIYDFIKKNGFDFMELD